MKQKKSILKKILITIFLGSFLLLNNFYVQPVLAMQQNNNSPLNHTLLNASEAYDTTAQQEIPAPDSQLLPASLEQLAQNDGISYRSLGDWPKESEQAQADGHLSFVFDFDSADLNSSDEIKNLNFYHYFSIAENTGLDVGPDPEEESISISDGQNPSIEEWFYEIYDQNDLYLGEISVDVNSIDLNGLIQDQIDLGSIITDFSNLTGLRIDFYLLTADCSESFKTNHDYVALGMDYEPNLAPQIILQSPADKAIFNLSNLKERVVKLNWLVNDGNNDFMEIELAVGLGNYNKRGECEFTGTAQKFVFKDQASGMMMQKIDLPKDGAYCWQVLATDNKIVDPVIASRDFSLDLTAPNAPVLSLQKDDCSAYLSWNEVETGATYDVYRNDLFLGNTGNFSWLDTGLEKGQSYIYYVVAIDASGNQSAASNNVCIYIPNPQISSLSFVSADVAVSTQNQNQSVVPSNNSQQQNEQVDNNQGEVKSENTDNSTQMATNWALVIAIILAGLLILGGGLYWWYSREEDEI